MVIKIIISSQPRRQASILLMNEKWKLLLSTEANKKKKVRLKRMDQSKELMTANKILTTFANRETICQAIMTKEILYSDALNSMEYLIDQ